MVERNAVVRFKFETQQASDSINALNKLMGEFKTTTVSVNQEVQKAFDKMLKPTAEAVKKGFKDLNKALADIHKQRLADMAKHNQDTLKEQKEHNDRLIKLNEALTKRIADLQKQGIPTNAFEAANKKLKEGLQEMVDFAGKKANDLKNVAGTFGKVWTTDMDTAVKKTIAQAEVAFNKIIEQNNKRLANVKAGSAEEARVKENALKQFEAAYLGHLQKLNKLDDARRKEEAEKQKKEYQKKYGMSDAFFGIKRGPGTDFGGRDSFAAGGIRKAAVTGISESLGSLTSELGAVGAAMGALGPYGVVAGAALGGIKKIIGDASEAYQKFVDMNIAISTLLSNKQEIGLSQEMDKLRLSSRNTGIELTSLQQTVYNIIGASMEMSDDLKAATSAANRFAQAAVGMRGSAEDTTIATTALSNSLSLTLKDEQNQKFILDQLAYTMNAGVVPNLKVMSHYIARSGEAMRSVHADSKQAMMGISSLNAFLTASGVSMEVANSRIKKFAEEMRNPKIWQSFVEMGAKGIDATTGKFTDFMAFVKSVSGNVGQFADKLKSTYARDLIRGIARDGGAAFEQYWKGAKDSAGLANDMFRKMEKSGEMAHKRLATSWNDLLVTIGENWYNTTDGLGKTLINNLSGALNWLSDQWKNNDLKAREAMTKLEGLQKAGAGLGEARTGLERIQGEESKGMLGKELSGEKEAVLSNIRAKLEDIRTISPTIADEITKVLNNPNNATNEKMTELIRLLKMADEQGKITQQGLGQAAAASSGAAFGDVLKDQMSTGESISNFIRKGLKFTGLSGLALDQILPEKTFTDPFERITKELENSKTRIAELKAEYDKVAVGSAESVALNKQLTEEFAKQNGYQTQMDAITKSLNTQMNTAMQALIQTNPTWDSAKLKAEAVKNAVAGLPPDMIQSKAVIEAITKEAEKLAPSFTRASDQAKVMADAAKFAAEYKFEKQKATDTANYQPSPLLPEAAAVGPVAPTTVAPDLTAAKASLELKIQELDLSKELDRTQLSGLAAAFEKNGLGKEFYATALETLQCERDTMYAAGETTGAKWDQLNAAIANFQTAEQNLSLTVAQFQAQNDLNLSLIDQKDATDAVNQLLKEKYNFNEMSLDQQIAAMENEQKAIQQKMENLAAEAKAMGAIVKLNYIETETVEQTQEAQKELNKLKGVSIDAGSKINTQRKTELEAIVSQIDALSKSNTAAQKLIDDARQKQQARQALGLRTDVVESTGKGRAAAGRKAEKEAERERKKEESAAKKHEKELDKEAERREKHNKRLADLAEKEMEIRDKMDQKLQEEQNKADLHTIEILANKKKEEFEQIKDIHETRLKRKLAELDFISSLKELKDRLKDQIMGFITGSLTSMKSLIAGFGGLGQKQYELNLDFQIEKETKEGELQKTIQDSEEEKLKIEKRREIESAEVSKYIYEMYKTGTSGIVAIGTATKEAVKEGLLGGAQSGDNRARLQSAMIGESLNDRLQKGGNIDDDAIRELVLGIRALGNDLQTVTKQSVITEITGKNFNKSLGEFMGMISGASPAKMDIIEKGLGGKPEEKIVEVLVKYINKQTQSQFTGKALADLGMQMAVEVKSAMSGLFDHAAFTKGEQAAMQEFIANIPNWVKSPTKADDKILASFNENLRFLGIQINGQTIQYQTLEDAIGKMPEMLANVRRLPQDVQERLAAGQGTGKDFTLYQSSTKMAELFFIEWNRMIQRSYNLLVLQSGNAKEQETLFKKFAEEDSKIAKDAYKNLAEKTAAYNRSIEKSGGAMRSKEVLAAGEDLQLKTEHPIIQGATNAMENMRKMQSARNVSKELQAYANTFQMIGAVNEQIGGVLSTQTKDAKDAVERLRKLLIELEIQQEQKEKEIQVKQKGLESFKKISGVKDVQALANAYAHMKPELEEINLLINKIQQAENPVERGKAFEEYNKKWTELNNSTLAYGFTIQDLNETTRELLKPETINPIINAIKEADETKIPKAFKTELLSFLKILPTLQNVTNYFNESILTLNRSTAAGQHSWRELTINAEKISRIDTTKIREWASSLDQKDANRGLLEIIKNRMAEKQILEDEVSLMKEQAALEQERQDALLKESSILGIEQNRIKERLQVVSYQYRLQRKQEKGEALSEEDQGLQGFLSGRGQKSKYIFGEAIDYQTKMADVFRKTLPELEQEMLTLNKVTGDLVNQQKEVGKTFDVSTAAAKKNAESLKAAEHAIASINKGAAQDFAAKMGEETARIRQNKDLEQARQELEKMLDNVEGDLYKKVLGPKQIESMSMDQIVAAQKQIEEMVPGLKDKLKDALAELNKEIDAQNEKGIIKTIQDVQKGIELGFDSYKSFRQLMEAEGDKGKAEAAGDFMKKAGTALLEAPYPLNVAGALLVLGGTIASIVSSFIEPQKTALELQKESHEISMKQLEIEARKTQEIQKQMDLYKQRVDIGLELVSLTEELAALEAAHANAPKFQTEYRRSSYEGGSLTSDYRTIVDDFDEAKNALQEMEDALPAMEKKVEDIKAGYWDRKKFDTQKQAETAAQKELDYMQKRIGLQKNSVGYIEQELEYLKQKMALEKQIFEWKQKQYQSVVDINSEMAKTLADTQALIDRETKQIDSYMDKLDEMVRKQGDAMTFDKYKDAGSDYNQYEKSANLLKAIMASMSPEELLVFGEQYSKMIDEAEAKSAELKSNEQIKIGENEAETFKNYIAFLRDTLGESMSQELSDFLDATLKEMEDKIGVIEKSYEKRKNHLSLLKNAGLLSEQEYKDQLLGLLQEELDLMIANNATEDEQLKIKGEIYQLTHDQNALEKEQNEILSARLREMHKQRQELIFKARLGQLTPGDQQAIKDLEAQIVAEMTTAGATAEAIDAVKRSFAAASYDVGSPFIPQDQLAMVHKGERIFTAAENRYLLDLLNQLAGEIHAQRQPMFDTINNYRTRKDAVEYAKIDYMRGGSGTFAPVVSVNVTGSKALSEKAVGKAVVDELKRMHTEWHKATGNFNGR